jgi:dipeptide/tripeptide permease
MSAAPIVADAPAAADHSLPGHPCGPAYLAFTDAWAQCLFYGMPALPLLYLVRQLLHPGQIESIAGVIALRVRTANRDR